MPSRSRSPSASRAGTRALLAEFARTGDPEVRARLVQAHANLVLYLARKYAGRGEPLEDIVQVGQIGLLAAIDRYDPGRGTEFSTYAMATIVGEIKRYFRDKSWAIHVPRRLRELNNSLMRTMERLAQQIGRSPTIPEIAEAAGASFEDVVEALEVGQAYNPASLDADVAAGGGDPATLGDFVGAEDPELDRMQTRHTVEEALKVLPERHQEILRLRYQQELSQAEIARRLGISQMHVSRVQREALQRLRGRLTEEGENAGAPEPD